MLHSNVPVFFSSSSLVSSGLVPSVDVVDAAMLTKVWSECPVERHVTRDDCTRRQADHVTQDTLATDHVIVTRIFVQKAATW